VDCGGRRAPVGAARAALGGGGRASLAQPPWRWRANHAPLELLLRLHATHLAVMGKKRGGEQAVRALPGVPSDSVACDNLGLAVLSIPNAHRVFGSNGNGPVSSSMLRTASALALALFLAGMLNA